MPPKRPRKQPRHQILEQSDYDSEVHITDHNGVNALPSAPPPTRTNEELNLTVLQRHDPDVQQILSVAPFAVVYYFSSTSQTWEKSGVEGTLFVSQLTPEATEQGLVVERYGVMVLNRKGLNNFSTELRSEAHVDITEQYVILQVEDEEEGVEGAAGDQIYGLWIFSESGSSTEHAREINAQVIMECATRSGKSREIAYGAFDGEEDGYGEEIEPIEHDENMGFGHAQPVGHAFHQPSNPPVELAATQQSQQVHQSQQGQQIDLLSLFGNRQPAAPQAEYNDYPAHQQNHGLPPQHYQQQQPQHSQFSHAHPTPPPQVTQAQSLLNLFKR